VTKNEIGVSYGTFQISVEGELLVWRVACVCEMELSHLDRRAAVFLCEEPN